ncbi:MAG: hypothetical protein AAF950_17750 [Pseudomonadota bacterium]
MSVERVLRNIGDDNADKLADAWGEFDRRMDRQSGELHLEISKANHKSTVNVWIAGLTLAGFLGSALFIGIELGSLKERIGVLETKVESVEQEVVRTTEAVTGLTESLSGLD